MPEDPRTYLYSATERSVLSVNGEALEWVDFSVDGAGPDATVWDILASSFIGPVGGPTPNWNKGGLCHPLLERRQSTDPA
jgi:hypothetical protein